MARSLFQKPRATGFRGRYAPDFEEDEWPLQRNVDFAQQKKRSFFSRLPLLVKIIVLLFCAAIGLMAGFVVWLIELVIMH